MTSATRSTGSTLSSFCGAIVVCFACFLSGGLVHGCTAGRTVGELVGIPDPRAATVPAAGNPHVEAVPIGKIRYVRAGSSAMYRMEVPDGVCYLFGSAISCIPRGTAVVPTDVTP